MEEQDEAEIFPHCVYRPLTTRWSRRGGGDVVRCGRLLTTSGTGGLLLVGATDGSNTRHVLKHEALLVACSEPVHCVCMLSAWIAATRNSSRNLALAHLSYS